jgi:hypothetical protein
MDRASDVSQGSRGWEVDIVAMYADDNLAASAHDGLPNIVPERARPPWRPPCGVQTWI